MGPEPLRWAELSAPAVLGVLAAQPDTVALVPVGATEQHGAHLPTGTDTILAEALCDAVSSATAALGLPAALVLPALPLGASWWHGSELGGTLATSGERVASAAGTVATWAAHSGVRRLLFVNGHVGNSAALSLACDRLRHERRELAVGVVEWWRLSPEIEAEVVSDASDWHANRAETSLMLAVAPHLVDLVAAKSADDEDRTAGLVFRYRVAQVTRSGVTGRPSEADAELGRRLWALVLAAATDVVVRAQVELPPLRG